jgi:hypothetical protein
MTEGQRDVPDLELDPTIWCPVDGCKGYCACDGTSWCCETCSATWNSDGTGGVR